MSKIVNEYGVLDCKSVLEDTGLRSAVDRLTSELKTFAQVYELNGEEIDQLYKYFSDEIICSGIGVKFRYVGKRRKELREQKEV